MSIMAVSFCEETANIWKMFGEVLNIIRIVIPIIIIVLGMLDLGKIVLSGDSKAMKESQKMFIKRLIYGVAIFFLGTVVKLVFELVDNNIAEGENKACWTCMSRPDSKACNKYIENQQEKIDEAYDESEKIEQDEDTNGSVNEDESNNPTEEDIYDEQTQSETIEEGEYESENTYN